MTTSATSFARLPSSPSKDRLPAALRWSAWGLLALLAGCANQPLPPWSPAPLGSPTGPSTSSAAPMAAAPAPTDLPYAAAVAARFADPAVRYRTPGLEAGRTSFTSNEEVVQWLRALAERAPGASGRLGVITIGSSQQGTPITALVATKASAITPAALDGTARPTVLLVAGQEGTDAAGTEALLTMAKELASDGLLAPLLDKANLIVVPRANPDGFSKQTAATADGTLLATDHLQLKTPEARALAKLMGDYRPAVVADASEFAAIEPAISQLKALRANDAGLQYGLGANVHEFVVNAEQRWLHRAATQSLTQAGQSVDWIYTVHPDTPVLRMGSLAPTSLRNVSALKNVPSLSIQSRGADLGRTHIQRRVHTIVTALTAVIHESAARAGDLSKVQSFVGRDIASQACKGQATVAVQPTSGQRDIVMLHPDTGANTTLQLSWSSAQEARSVQQRARPCGYWLSAQSQLAVERLRLLGVQVQRIAEAAPVLADGYLHTSATTRDAVTIERKAVDAAPGSYYVSMNQPLANVAVAALEPDMPYSFYATGVLPQLQQLARVMAPSSLVFEEE